MDKEAVEELVASISVEGWVLSIQTEGEHCWVYIEKLDPPVDNRNPQNYLDSYGDKVQVSPNMSPDFLIEKIFATLQFLIDHELREQFMVDGERIFECHEPSLTGMQHDWFVEHKSALRGY